MLFPSNYLDSRIVWQTHWILVESFEMSTLLHCFSNNSKISGKSCIFNFPSRNRFSRVVAQAYGNESPNRTNEAEKIYKTNTFLCCQQACHHRTRMFIHCCHNRARHLQRFWTLESRQRPIASWAPHFARRARIKLCINILLWLKCLNSQQCNSIKLSKKFFN